jgi:hypothetical protein
MKYWPLKYSYQITLSGNHKEKRTFLSRLKADIEIEVNNCGFLVAKEYKRQQEHACENKSKLQNFSKFVFVS